ncbi:MAG TPA: hypothetical protein VNY05_35370 [Candidatus Acidoferrales bacterium]|jgi:hypothetical protein|nr:hypothetical protein [Candidatus Acidoferrales bacterium]
MRRTLNLLCSAILIAGSISAYAAPQDPAGAPPKQPETGTAPKTKMKGVKLSGTVKAYEPGKSIEVDAKGAPHVYDLAAPDMTVTVSPDVKIGGKVKVTEASDSSGKKTVMIEGTGGTN